MKVQERINNLKKQEKQEYDKRKIKGLNLDDLLNGKDPKSIIYDPALLDWDNLSEEEKNRKT